MAQRGNYMSGAETTHRSDWSTEVQPMAETMGVMPAVPSSPMHGQQGPYYHIPYEVLRDGTIVGGRDASLDMSNPLTKEEMENPSSNAAVYQGSMKSLLSRNLGHYVVVTFQMAGAAPE